ncbi:MAG TPA: hypothetical protein VGP16_30090, partial [Asanoa sp.]|nr:hypothetical protein [Asanoa sp.]
MWTEWILRHRRLVMLGWLVLAVVGGALAPRTIDRLSYEFSFPGQPAYEANQRIERTFGGGGGAVDPLVVTVTLPAGRAVTEPSVREELGTALAPLRRPGWRVASALDVADPAPFISADGRTTFALVYPPFTPGPGPYAAALPQIEETLASTPVGGAPLLVTG